MNPTNHMLLITFLRPIQSLSDNDSADRHVFDDKYIITTDSEYAKFSWECQKNIQGYRMFFCCVHHSTLTKR